MFFNPLQAMPDASATPIPACTSNTSAPVCTEAGMRLQNSYTHDLLCCLPTSSACTTSKLNADSLRKHVRGRRAHRLRVTVAIPFCLITGALLSRCVCKYCRNKVPLGGARTSHKHWDKLFHHPKAFLPFQIN